MHTNPNYYFYFFTVHHGINPRIGDILLKLASIHSISNVLWLPMVWLRCFSCLCAITIKHFSKFSSTLSPKSTAVTMDFNLMKRVCASSLNITFRSERKSVQRNYFCATKLLKYMKRNIVIFQLVHGNGHSVQSLCIL